jgi:hypothetical protein
MAVITNISIRVGLEKRGNIKWKGKLYVATHVDPNNKGSFLGGGSILAVLDSEPPPGSEIKPRHSTFIIMMFGFTYGATDLSGTIGGVELEIPSLFESPKYLNGPVSWLSATAAIGKWGITWTTTSIGYAYGELSIKGDRDVIGLDVGIDAMMGLSICIKGCS